MTTREEKKNPAAITKAELAQLGGGQIGYIRRIGIDAAKAMLGRPVTVEDNAQLFCLYMADGTPVAISDSHAAAKANANAHNVYPLSVH